MIDTATASVASSLDATTLATLPTAGRNAFYLATTTPNVVPSGDPQFVRQQDQTNSSLLSLGGGPRRANNYTLEGVSITDMRNRATFIPSIEAVEEVKVQVSTYDAEMGRTGGGVFNTVGKSGSNVWHGSGLDAEPSRVGGRQVLLPRRPSRNRTATSGCTAARSAGPSSRTARSSGRRPRATSTKTSRSAVLFLPTDLERRGDFSQSGVTVYDPLTTTCDPAGACTRQPFENNRIPDGRINPVARAAMTYLPSPTSGNSRPAIAELIDRGQPGDRQARSPHQRAAQHFRNVRWYDSEEPESRFYGKTLGENPGDPGEGLLLRTVHAAIVNSLWMPNQTTVWNFRYGFTQFIDDDVPNAFDPATLNFAPSYLALIPYQKFPSLNVQGYGSVEFRHAWRRSPQDTTYTRTT